MDALLAYNSSDSGDEDIGPKLPRKTKNHGCYMQITDERYDGKASFTEARVQNNKESSDKLKDCSKLSYGNPLANQTPCTVSAKTVFPEGSFNPKHEISQKEIGPFLPSHYGNCSNSSGYSELDKPICGPIRPAIAKTSTNNSFKIKPYVSKREREKLLQASKASTSGTITGKVNLIDEITESKETDYGGVVNRPPKRVYTQFQGHSKCINHIRWNPTKQNLLASASMDHTVAIWDTNTNGLCVNRFTFHEAAVKDVEWRSCGTQMLSCGYDKSAKLVDIDSGNFSLV